MIRRSGSYDQTVWLWDAVTGAPLQTLEGHSSSVNSVAFSPNGKQVVSGFDDLTVQLWDVVTETLLQTLEGYGCLVSSIAFLPDGKQVVSGSYDQTVRLWDAITGALLQTLEGHSGWVSSIAFSPNGKQVVSGFGDQMVQLWDAVTGALLQTFEGHGDLVRSVAFSCYGKQIVSSSDDKMVWLWDAVTGALLQTLKGHTDSVSSATFLPDSKQLPILQVSNYWVVEGNTNILWLPPDYRKTYSATCVEQELGLQGARNSRVKRSFCSSKKEPAERHTYTHSCTSSTNNILYFFYTKLYSVPSLFTYMHAYLYCSTTWNRSLVIGHSSGRISFFCFKKGAKLVI